MEEINADEIKHIQIEILEYVHHFCEENGIRYSLSSGTLLGAIRHKGYIPWDDDIDLYMLRPDYNRLIQEFNGKCPDHFRIIAPEIDKDYIFPFAKVIDTRTTVKENVDHYIDYMGIWIDVFPVDSVPDDLGERKRLFMKNRFLDNLIILKNVSINKNRSFIKNSLLFCGKFALTFISMRNLIQRKLSLTSKWDSTAKDVCNIMAGGGIKGCIPQEIMNDYINIEFEGRTFRCMRDYDFYLRTCYGNYMQLPPIEKRITHHSFKAYWKRLYTTPAQ